VDCPVRRGAPISSGIAGPYGTATALPPPGEVAPPVDLATAESFVRLHHAEVLGADPTDRLNEVRAELDRTGDYTHTPGELLWAARVAWRNADRCVGRTYWNGLRVRDRRHVDDLGEVAADTIEHARVSFNGGHIRPTMTVFAAATPGNQRRIGLVAASASMSSSPPPEEGGRSGLPPLLLLFLGRRAALGPATTPRLRTAPRCPS